MKNTAAFLLFASLLPVPVFAQTSEMKHDMSHKKAPAVPSTSLKVTGLDGNSVTFSADDIKNMTHMKVTVHNMHTNADETYSGVPVSEFIKRVEPRLASGEKLKVKPLMMVIVFGGTDEYRVVLTECDVDPSCRNGIVLIADSVDDKPLTEDGAFKLISTEDKKPQRWVRNLTSVVIKAIQ